MRADSLLATSAGTSRRALTGPAISTSERSGDKLTLMDVATPRRAWLLMAAGDDRGHGGNEGYDDQIDAYYSWDSNVPNHRNLSVGDPIAIWDKQRLLGVSVIEEIQAEAGTKLLRRCPTCWKTRISERKSRLPRYRCMRCKAEFDEAVPDVVPVTVYRARYDAAWTALDGALNEDDLRALAKNPGDINAMRPLDWVGLTDALAARGAVRAVDRLVARADLSVSGAPSRPGVEFDPPQGHAHAFVRVRRGQRQFRDHLLSEQGGMCAFTGPAPERVLEAGHLYSYAQLGTHYRHGGLLLRRDIHRLFDDGLLSVQPSRLCIDVAPDLAKFPQYGRLHGERLTLQLRSEQVDWLAQHWEEHRTSTR
ncbi:hypothetical protein Cma02nite_28240 [Cellulomonas marina]|nr:hypothetical protein Cma02nite_28240 [Cellulomonas marina]